MILLYNKTFEKNDINKIIDYLNTETIKVSVFGEFGTGKSTFINAINQILIKQMVCKKH